VLSLDDVRAAQSRLAGKVFLSPCAQSQSLSAKLGAECRLKLENLQRTGSFKERGACNKLGSLSVSERGRGVICSSAGNHAQGVAYHASLLGVDATVVMPEQSPLVKVQNTRNFGARVILAGGNYDEAYAHAKKIEAEEGRVFVHPFDDALVMAGQGTIGLEILEQMPQVEAVVVAVGGGGLAAGIATAVKALRPDVKLYGVQTAAVPGMKAALAAGAPVTLDPAVTLADGIAVRRVAEQTRAILARLLDDLVTVDEEEIAEAILTLLEREKTVAEGAGAAPVAAILEDRLPLHGKRTCVVLCGGNIDVTLMSRIIERGLVKTGRLFRFSVVVGDVAGSLARLTRAVADTKANVVQIHHDRAFSKADLVNVEVEMVLETRGPDHVEQVRAALAAQGYLVITDIGAKVRPAPGATS
jgi:threonine dehydratase